MKKFIPILLLTFINILGFSILIPVFPEVIRGYVTHDTGAFYGLLLSSYAFCQFLSAPFLGKLSDAYGRKKILLVSQLGTTLGWVLMIASTFMYGMIGSVPAGFLMLIISRVADGITGGNISVASAWISDTVKPEERTKLFGFMGATFGVGFMIGPLLGGLTYTWAHGLIGPAVLAFFLSLVTLLLLQFGLRESHPVEKRTVFHWGDVHLLREINILHQINLVQNKLVRKSFFLRAGFALAFSMFTTAIVLIMEDNLGFTPRDIGLFMGMIGIFSILNQGFVIPRAAKKLHDVSYFFGSILMAALMLLMLPASLMIHNKLLFWIAFILNTYLINFSLSSNMTVFKTLVAKHSENQRGFTMAVDDSMMSFGNGVSPLVAGSIIGWIGQSLFIYVGMALLLLTLVVYKWTHIERAHHKHTIS